MNSMKNAFLICACAFLISCNGSKGEGDISKEDIIIALNFAISDVISENPNYEDYLLLGNFTKIISGSQMTDELLNVDSVLNQTNVNYMIDQYYSRKGELLSPYISETYHDKIVDKLTYREGLVCFELSPPLFSVDKNCFVLNMIGYFSVKSNEKWDALYFVFFKKDNKWKLEGIIK